MLQDMSRAPIIPLTPETLVAAYASGIFPMDVDGQIEWFSPDPRTIIPLDAFHASRSLRRTLRRGTFEIRFNTAFEPVMRGCADRAEGTWISEEIVEAFVRLHELGLAHSIETWRNDELAGGLYGVALGGAFFGESMFSRQRDASKVALAVLVERLRTRGFTVLDVQFTTPHLARLGALEIRRAEYHRRLRAALARSVRFVD